MSRAAVQIAVLGALACGGMKSPGSVADRFVDKYYVESDQESALPYTSGLAAMRLRAELKLTEGARAPGLQLRQVRVYYKRTHLDKDGDSRAADYELDIRPQGGGTLERRAHLELSRERDGTWRVVRFSETQGR